MIGGAGWHQQMIDTVEPCLKEAGWTFDEFIAKSSLEYIAERYRREKGESFKVKEPENPITEPKPIDVFMGRGTYLNAHSGNWLFRQVVAMNKVVYQSMEKHEKTKVSRALKYHLESAGCRFLDIERHQNGRKTYRLADVPRIVEKCSQGLREKKFTLKGLVPRAFERAKKALCPTAKPVERVKRQSSKNIKVGSLRDDDDDDYDPNEQRKRKKLKKTKSSTKKDTLAIKGKKTLNKDKTMKKKYKTKDKVKKKKSSMEPKAVTPCKTTKKGKDKVSPQLNTPDSGSKIVIRPGGPSSAGRVVQMWSQSSQNLVSPQTLAESEFAATVSLSSTEGSSTVPDAYARLSPLRPVTLSSLSRTPITGIDSDKQIAAFTESYRECKRCALDMLHNHQHLATDLYPPDVEAAELAQVLRPQKIRRIHPGRLMAMPVFCE
jgi:hypothetical protein